MGVFTLSEPDAKTSAHGMQKKSTPVFVLADRFANRNDVIVMQPRVQGT